MGYKLEGEPIKSTLNGIISEGICFGSIQIPPDGKPIVLLKEHQTIGGYPKIGVVLDLDCYKLAQAKPGTKISFKKISFDEATKIKKNFLFTFNQ
jgi:allophanate hydrolase subunit 2